MFLHRATTKQSERIREEEHKHTEDYRSVDNRPVSTNLMCDKIRVEYLSDSFSYVVT